MGLFDFLKPKPSKTEEIFARMRAEMFPKGQKDVDAVVDSLLFIVNNKINRQEAERIVLKSMAMNFLSAPNEFTKERLKEQCPHHFNEKEVELFHGYISFLFIASQRFGKTPSELIREGDAWYIPK
jgi:hypothetical protein